MFKIPRKSLEFLLLSFVSTESCVGDKRGKRSKRERMILQGLGEGLGTKGVCIDTSSQNPARTAKSPSVRAIGA